MSAKEEAQPVIIDWEDACYNLGEDKWEYQLIRMQTLGWGIEKEDRWILYDELNIKEATYRHVMCIPKVGIKKVTYLKAIEGV